MMFCVDRAFYNRIENGEDVVVFVLFLFSFITVMLSISTSVKKLHNAGFKEWPVMLHFISGPIFTFILLLIKDKPGPNQYGPDPNQ